VIIPVGFAQVNLQWEWLAGGHHAECAYGIAVDDVALGPVEVAATIGGIYTAVGMDGVQSSAISLVNVHVKFGPNETGGAADVAAGIDGALSGAGVTPNTSLLVHKRTEFGGRRGSGRFYWPGIEEGVVGATGLLSTEAHDTFQGLFEDFLNAHVDASVPVYLLHGDEVAGPHAVVSVGVDNLVATQRRRLRA